MKRVKWRWVRWILLSVGILFFIILGIGVYLYLGYIRPIQAGNTQKVLALARHFEDDFAAQNIIDWEMDLTLEPQHGRLKAKGKVTVRRENLEKRKLYFMLNPGLEIESLHINDLETSAKRFWFLMWTTIPKQISDRTVHLSINYQGSIDPLFGQWYCGEISSRQTVLWDASLWYPQEMFLFPDRFHAHISLACPDSFDVVIPGNLIAESIQGKVKRTEWELVPEEGRFPLIAGIFQEWETSVDGKHLGIYAPAESKVDGPTILGFAEQGLRYYLDRFGDPGRGRFSFFIPKTRQLYSMYSGGGVFILVGRYEQIRPSYALLINHELAHNWLPGVVDVEWIHGHDWIGEGFCEYATLQVAQDAIPPRDYYDMKWAYEGFQPHFQKPLSEAVGLFGDRVDAEMSYQKGAFVYLMMEQIVGETELQEALRSLFEHYRGQSISPETYLTALDAHCTNDLEPFFQDWVYKTGTLDFAIEEVFPAFIGNPNHIKVTIRNTGDIACPYPVEIVCISDGKVDRILHPIPQEGTEIVFEIDGGLQKIIVDPELNWADMNRMNNIYPISAPVAGAVPSPDHRYCAVIRKDYSRFASSFHRWSFDPLYASTVLEIYNKEGDLCFKTKLPGEIMMRAYSQPVWNRSGTRLLFRYWDPAADRSRIMMYNSDQDTIRDWVYGFTPQWMDDGRIFIYGTEEGALMQMDITNKSNICVSENLGRYVHPNLSLHRDKTAVIDENTLHVVSLSDGSSKVVYESEGLKNVCTWATGGDHLYFVVSAGEGDDIIRLHSNTGEETVVLNASAPISYMTASPDGQFLCYVTSEESDEKVVHIFNLDKEVSRVLNRIRCENLYPFWWNQGSEILYSLPKWLDAYPSSLYTDHRLAIQNVVSGEIEMNEGGIR